MPEKLRIDALYAFIAEDAEGEGVCAFQDPAGRWLPMVGADGMRVESLKPIAQQIARKSGQRIRLVRFAGREELEVFEPEGKLLA